MKMSDIKLAEHLTAMSLMLDEFSQSRLLGTRECWHVGPCLAAVLHDS